MLQDKSPLKSWTVWGMALIAGVQALESQGAIPTGFATNLAGLAQALGVFLAGVGIRRAVGA